MNVHVLDRSVVLVQYVVSNVELLLPERAGLVKTVDLVPSRC